MKAARLYEGCQAGEARSLRNKLLGSMKARLRLYQQEEMGAQRFKELLSHVFYYCFYYRRRWEQRFKALLGSSKALVKL
jgi:hypothetical protein